MTPQMRRAGSGEADPRECAPLASKCNRETTLPAYAVQQLQRRFGLSPELARILAELAFRVEAPR